MLNSSHASGLDWSTGQYPPLIPISRLEIEPMAEAGSRLSSLSRRRYCADAGHQQSLFALAYASDHPTDYRHLSHTLASYLIATSVPPVSLNDLFSSFLCVLDRFALELNARSIPPFYLACPLLPLSLAL